MVIIPNGQLYIHYGYLLVFITSHGEFTVAHLDWVVTIIDYHQVELYLTNLTNLLNDLTTIKGKLDWIHWKKKCQPRSPKSLNVLCLTGDADCSLSDEHVLRGAHVEAVTVRGSRRSLQVLVVEGVGLASSVPTEQLVSHPRHVDVRQIRLKRDSPGFMYRVWNQTARGCVQSLKPDSQSLCTESETRQPRVYVQSLKRDSSGFIYRVWNGTAQGLCRAWICVQLL